VTFTPDRDCPDGLKIIGNNTSAFVKETIAGNISTHGIIAICSIVIRSLGCCNRIAQCFNIEFVD
jgi:hypothetical protein